MIPTDKILSIEEFKKRLSFDELDELENFDALMEAYSQLAALCREQQRWIRSANGSLRDDSQAPGYSELIVEGESLLAAFPETLREK